MTLKEGLEPKCSFSSAGREASEEGLPWHCAPVEGPAQLLVWGVFPMVSHPPVPALHPTSSLTLFLSPPSSHCHLPFLTTCPPGVPGPLSHGKCHQAGHCDLPKAWGGQ